MLLANKNAVIYGAGGSLGGAVARALARQGATIFLAGRRIEPLLAVKEDIIRSGGKAETATMDALDESSVNHHLEQITATGASIDISYNAIDLQVVQNIPLTEMTVNDFARPVTIAMTTHFLTATAAARVMMKQRSGVILTLTATPGGIAYPLVGGFGPACNAIEGFSGNLAAELGRYGIRVINIRSGGSPDSRLFKEAVASMGETAMASIRKLQADTMLKQLPLMEDIANLAVFLSSDLCAKITGVTIDVTAGTTTGLNADGISIPFRK